MPRLRFKSGSMEVVVWTRRNRYNVHGRAVVENTLQHESDCEFSGRYGHQNWLLFLSRQPKHALKRRAARTLTSDFRAPPFGVSKNSTVSRKSPHTHRPRRLQLKHRRSISSIVVRTMRVHADCSTWRAASRTQTTATYPSLFSRPYHLSFLLSTL